MNVKKFKAKNLHDALRLVREELGPDAAVLSTRDVTPRGPLRWFCRHRIEVSASNQMNVPSRLGGPRRRTAKHPSRQNRNTAAPAKQAAAGITDASCPPTTNLETVAATAGAPSALENLREQLLELQSRIHDLRAAPDDNPPDAPDAAFKVFTDLIEADMPEGTARELIEQARAALRPDELNDAGCIAQFIRQSIEASIKVTGEINVAVGQRRLVALVGPTGVGKTTTIAKLAAHYRLRERRKVALITVDTYRIAAVDQLQTYADIIDVPMEVVSTPREMRAATERLQDYELVLMDTAGRSPRDEIKLQELKSMLAEAHADEVHLVLSAVSGASNLARATEQFAGVGTTSLILTKLDEATSHGHLLTPIRQSNVALSYVTDGQNVPDDIEPANEKKLAELILRTGAA
jgi:flagellar biosynthesis protein FlhF